MAWTAATIAACPPRQTASVTIAVAVNAAILPQHSQAERKFPPPAFGCQKGCAAVGLPVAAIDGPPAAARSSAKAGHDGTCASTARSMRPRRSSRAGRVPCSGLRAPRRARRPPRRSGPQRHPRAGGGGARAQRSHAYSSPAARCTADMKTLQAWRCCSQLLAACRRQFVEPAPALAGAFDPPAGNDPLRLQAIEDRIQGRDVEHDRAVRSLLDADGDVVAMARLVFELREHEQLRGALLERVVVGRSRHMSESYIYQSASRRQDGWSHDGRSRVWRSAESCTTLRRGRRRTRWGRGVHLIYMLTRLRRAQSSPNTSSSSR